MDHAKEQALSQLSYICAIVANLDTDDEDFRDKAVRAIEEHPLEILYRSGWYSQGQLPPAPEEAMILLCTGRPDVRIIVQLEGEYYADSKIEYQDWGTPWTELKELTHEDKETIRIYCSVLGV